VRRQRKSVDFDDFKKAVEKIGPSITPDMENWYRSVTTQLRKPVKPSTPIV
jgi:hypothetical protein